MVEEEEEKARGAGQGGDGMVLMKEEEGQGEETIVGERPKNMEEDLASVEEGEAVNVGK